MKQNTGRSRCRRSGFTLFEMLVAATISVLLVIGLVRLYISQRYGLQAMQQINDMSQSVRTAVDQVVTDIRSAGYGIPETKFDDWITWVPGITGGVTVVQGATGAADILHIVTAPDPPCAYLASSSSVGATSITVGPGQGTNFNTSTRKVIYIGRSETARITAISGDTLSISTSPTASDSLNFGYGKGSSVELIKVITYSWGDDSATYPYTKYLKRYDNVRTYPKEFYKMIASNIEDFQISGQGEIPGQGMGADYKVTITGRATKEDISYTHPVKKDHYRRLSYTMDATTRSP